MNRMRLPAVLFQFGPKNVSSAKNGMQKGGTQISFQGKWLIDNHQTDSKQNPNIRSKTHVLKRKRGEREKCSNGHGLKHHNKLQGEQFQSHIKILIT